MNSKDLSLGFTTLLYFMNHKLEHANPFTQMIGLEGLQIETRLCLRLMVGGLTETILVIYFHESRTIKAIRLSNQNPN